MSSVAYENMNHGGDIYRNKVDIDFSVTLNPYGIPEKVAKALEYSIKRAGQYPDIRQEEVRNAIGHLTGLEKDSIYAGNGTSELIQASVRAVNPKKALLFEPGFSGYSHALKGTGCMIGRHILSEDNGFKITEADTEELKKGTDLVILTDPGNPSGKNLDDDILLNILERAEKNDTTVILDESFYFLSDRAAEGVSFRGRELLEKYDNLIIISSLTKLFAVPGVRIGYVFSTPLNIEKIIMQLSEWNLSVPGEEAVKAGIKVIKETDYIKQSVRLIKREREYMIRELKSMKLTVYDSDTACILFKGPGDLYEKLLKQRLLIRDCSDLAGLKKGYYRTAVRTHEDNEILIKSIRGILNGN